MSQEKLERDLGVLKLYAIASTICIVLLFLAAFGRSDRAAFEEISVERLNVVEPDGRFAVVIANQARLPGNIMDGREYSDREGVAGILFYNSEGDEAGGLVASSEGSGDSIRAFSQLSLDRFKSDQVAVLRYLESPRGWEAGLQVSHLPRGTLVEWAAAQDSIKALPEANRQEAVRELRRRFFQEGKWEIPRAFVGEVGRTAEIRLHDTRGRLRIRIVVDSLDVARLEFLDEAGRIVSRVPEQ